MLSEGLIFDLDGTLTNSDPLHFAAYTGIAKRYGVIIDERCFRDRISGRTNAGICQDLFAHVDPAEYQKIADEKEALFRHLLAGRLRPIAGLGALLAWGEQHGCGLAVVSNAPRLNIVAMLAELKLDKQFHEIVVASELARGKPDPLPYRTALDRLRVPVERAVAFEDAVPGVQSASRAGIVTVGLSTTFGAADLKRAGAMLVVGDYCAPALLEFVRSVLDGR